MPSKFGGIPVVEEAPKSKFGGIPVETAIANPASPAFSNRKPASLEELLGGTIVGDNTDNSQNKRDQYNQLASQLQKEAQNFEAVSQTSPLESAILGAESLPVGLASVLSIPLLKLLENSGPQGRAIAGPQRQVLSAANQMLQEGAAVNPVAGALGQSTANVLSIGPGGVVGNIAKGALIPAARQVAVATPLNVALGTGIRSLTGSGTTTNDVLNDSLLSLLGGRTGSVPSTVANQSENALSQALRENAQKNVAQALLRGGGTKNEKLIAERLAPQVLERPMSETFAMTGKGLENKATTQKEIAGDAIEAFGKLEGNTNPQKFVDSFEKLKAPYIVEGKVIDPEALQRINNLQDTFSQFGDSISDEGLRQIRRTFDNQIQESKGFLKDLNQGSALNLKKVAANEIRNLIAEKNPDLAKINKQFNFWSNLEEVTSSANTRTQAQTGFTSKLGSIIGLATGQSIGDAAARAITLKIALDAIKSPGWKLTTARIKDKIADAVSTADPENIFNSLKGVSGFDPEQVAKTVGVQASDSVDSTSPSP